MNKFVRLSEVVDDFLKRDATVTVKTSPQEEYSPFRRWDIIEHPQILAAGCRYSIITNVERDTEKGQYTLSNYPIRLSKWKIIRRIQVKIIKHVFRVD
jgi:hypothetical protein